MTFDPMELIAMHRAHRISKGLLAADGVACVTPEDLAYRNYRATLPRDEFGRIVMTTELRALKVAAEESKTQLSNLRKAARAAQ